MIEVLDYSGRRGVIVPMMDKIHGLLRENAEKDILADLPPPKHIILWKQEIRQQLTDVNTRWFFALDGRALAGVMFFHFGGGSPVNAENVYIDELQLAWAYRNNELLFTQMVDKFAQEQSVANAKAVYAGERVKNEENDELLASVGFKQRYQDGYQPLGTLAEAVNALKLRYRRV